MTNLVSAAEVQALVDTSVSSANLDIIITREEAEIIRRYGAHYTDVNTAITETHVREDGDGSENLFLARPILSVSSVSEKSTLTADASALTENTHYVTVADQGRLIRLGGWPQENRTGWGRIITVNYVPQDDTERRKRVIIELIRLALAREGYESENIAGEYSYHAPKEGWDVARQRLIASLGFVRA